VDTQSSQFLKRGRSRFLLRPSSLSFESALPLAPLYLFFYARFMISDEENLCVLHSQRRVIWSNVVAVGGRFFK